MHRDHIVKQVFHVVRAPTPENEKAASKLKSLRWIYVYCYRAQHLQETVAELLSIADRLLDGDPSPADAAALKARRQHLAAVRAALEGAGPTPAMVGFA